MVNIFRLLPSSGDLSSLKRLCGKIKIDQPVALVGATSKVRLTGSDGVTAQISVAYEDVVFKFECFGLMVDAEEKSFEPWGSNLLDVNENQKIACLFRFEWERPARPGEVRSDWEQIVRQRGARGSLPVDATSACVSMVGLMFDSLDGASPVMALVINDDEPGTLRILTEKAAVSVFIRDCEVVALEDASEWVERFQN